MVARAENAKEAAIVEAAEARSNADATHALVQAIGMGPCTWIQWLRFSVQFWLEPVRDTNVLGWVCTPTQKVAETAFAYTRR